MHLPYQKIFIGIITLLSSVLLVLSIKDNVTTAIIFHSVVILCAIIYYTVEYFNIKKQSQAPIPRLSSFTKMLSAYITPIKSHLSYLFLFFLTLITIGSLQFDFIQNIPLLHALVSFLSKHSITLTIFAIISGGLTFWIHKEEIETSEEQELQNEEQGEKTRLQEFPIKYPKINSIPVLRNIVRWMYVEGWWYSLMFVILVILSFILRIWSLDYIDGADNFTIIAVKNNVENGVSFYRDSFISFNLMTFFSKIFGYGMISLRLPSIIYSVISVTLIYFIAKNINKKVALLSVFLFAISPWSIIISRLTRDYSFDCMIGAILLLISVNLLKKINNGEIKKGIFYLLSTVIATYLISKFNIRGQTLITVIIPITALIFGVFFTIIKNIKRKSILTIFILSSMSILTATLYLVEYYRFKSGFHFNQSYFDFFFNSNTPSPWQWFHGNTISPLFMSLFILTPLLITFFLQKRNRLITYYLFSVFLLVLCIYIFKFISSTDNTTRYIYFLMPVYTIIFSLSLFYFTKLNKKFSCKIFSKLILVLIFFNLNSIYYAIDPIKIFEQKGIVNPKIDSGGLGRFDMYPVINYLKDDLNWDGKKIFVFAGRFNEFIYLLDYKMDDKRVLNTSNCDICNPNGYNIGKNMYVESFYWNIHELELAIIENKEGYFVSEDYCIANKNRSYQTNPGENCLQILENKNFHYNDVYFKFLKNINGYKIYYWSEKS
ncbi:MAG: glycosyltransferase family 39 protein [Candidatus Pacebacteria bacterium]|nr:glycosyltransferase family 39 protein [Candidatus Paceibacterota bacterium]